MKIKYQLIVILVFGTILSLIFTYLVIFGRALSQPENHVSILLALPKVIFSSDATQINGGMYLAKNNDSFITAMELHGFTFIEQMGSGYFFKKNEINYTSFSKMYSSLFMLFTEPSAY